MSGYSQYVLRKLDNPNELVDKGRYDLDKKLRLKYNELDIETMNMLMERKYESDYQLYWKSLNSQKRGEEEEQQDHECLIDDRSFRCKICGRCLKWTLYGIQVDSNPFEQKSKKISIDYYKYEYIMQRIQKLNEITSTNTSQKIYSIRNFTQFKNAGQMRDFVYFILCLPLAHGFTNQIQPYRDRNSFKVREQLTSNKTNDTNNRQSSFGKQIQNNKNNSNQNVEQNSERKIIPPISIRELNIDGEQSPQLEFFGDFEGANFLHAFYDPKNLKVQIILKADTNTDGFTSWFYFGVRVKTNDPLRINFEILNCRKEKSLFQQGMNVTIAQLQDSTVYNNFQNYSRLWRRDMAFDTKYQESSYPRKVFMRTKSLRVIPVNDYIETDSNFIPENSQIEEKCTKILDLQKKGIDITNEKENLFLQQLKDKKFIKNYFHGLSFIYQFQVNSKGSTVLFSQAIPYTFSNLIEFIESLEATIKQQNPLFKYSFNNDTRVYNIDCFNLLYEKTIIGSTSLGLPITELQITAPNSQRALNLSKRPYIFIIARQHPNETPASFVCQGLIKFLISNQEEAITLRQMFIFKIIPMVNPDGVVIGNSRVTIKGIDLNRSWEFCDQNNYPEIFCIKQKMQTIVDNKRSIYMFLDLHGHTTKASSFALCTLKEEASNYEWAKVRLFPKIIAENCRFFDINSCKYSLLPTEKNCCAREVLWRDLKVEHSYTLETSFFGSSNVFQSFIPGEVQNIDPDETSVKHFSAQDQEYIGQQVCKSILQFSACVILMLEQTLQNERVDITEDQLLSGQAMDQLEMPQSELGKLNDQQRRINANISNANGENSLIISTTQIKGQIGKETSTGAKSKKNLKSTTIAISKMLKLNSILNKKEKVKDGQILSEQILSQQIVTQQTKQDELGQQHQQSGVQEMQEAIINKNSDLNSGVNINTDKMITSVQFIVDNRKEPEEKKPEEKKQPYFMGLQQQQTKVQKTNAQGSMNNMSKSGEVNTSLTKFQQYVLKNKDQIKVLFQLKNGLDWHKFYDTEDIEGLREFKEQQKQNKNLNNNNNTNNNKQSSKSQFKMNMTESGEALPLDSNNNKSIFYQKEENNDSDSEPEDDIVKKYRRKGKDGKYGDGDSDGDENDRLTSSQRRLKELEDENEQNKKNLKTSSSDSFDEFGNKKSKNKNDLDGNPSMDLSDFEKQRLGLDFANSLNKNGLNYSSAQDMLGRNKNNSYGDKDGNSRSANKILLPTSQFVMSPRFTKLVPFNEKIKLKSPFLPTQDEIIEAYSMKSPNNIRAVANKRLLTEDGSQGSPKLAMSANLSGYQQPYINKSLNQEENESVFFRQAQSSKIINFGNLLQNELNESQNMVKKKNSVLSSSNNSPIQRKMIFSTDNVHFNNPNGKQQDDNRFHHLVSFQKENLNQPDKEEQMSQEQSQDYIVESSQLIPSKNINLRLDVRSESMQSDSFLNRSKIINPSMKDTSTSPRGTTSPIQNSIYGGLIAMQEQNTQKTRQRENSTLMKISVSTSLNSPPLSAKSSNPTSQRTVVTYRPLSGTKQIKIQKDMLIQQHQYQEDAPYTTPNNQFNSLPVSPKIDNENYSFTPQPSFRIKQQNINKIYKSFIDQQQNKLQKEQKQQEEIQKSQEKLNTVKRTQTPLRSYRASHTPQNSSQSFLRNSQPNFKKGVFSQNS